jgi:hypothetical protein
MMREPAFERSLRRYTEMVAEEMPWMFAVIQEHAECDEGWIAGWGMMFRGHLAVLGPDGRGWVEVGTPAEAERLFDRGDDITGLLVWCDPALN